MSLTNKKGFTLLEILIVLIILGVIAGIAVPAFQGQIEKGRAQEAYRNIGMLKESLVRFYSQREPATYTGAALPAAATACTNGIAAGQTVDFNPNCVSTGTRLFDYTVAVTGGGTGWTITATRNGGNCNGGTVQLTQAMQTPVGTGCFV